MPHNWPETNECNYCDGDYSVATGDVQCSECGNCAVYNQNGEKNK